MEVFLGIGILILALFWLFIWEYGLYSGGRKLANKMRHRLAIGPAVTGFALIGFIAAAPVMLKLNVHPLMASMLAFCVWLLISYPLSLGYWAALKDLRSEDENKWSENVENWIADWEEAELPRSVQDWED